MAMGNDMELEAMAKQIENGDKSFVPTASTDSDVSTNPNFIAPPPVAATKSEPEPAPAPAPSGIDDDDDDDDFVVSGVDMEKVGTEAPVTTEEFYKGIIEKNLADVKTINSGDYDEYTKKLIKDMQAFRKRLIVEEGMSPEEADEAVKNRANKASAEANTQYVNEHPQGVIVKIDKTNSDKVEFTEEEKAKMIKSPAIKLIEVEKKELGSLRIRRVDTPEQLMKVITKHTCCISKYSVPLLGTFDYATFSGASSMELLNAVVDPNDNLFNTVTNKINLAYRKFIGSTMKEKTDPEGNPIMTIEDFSNYLAYTDLDLCLYAIYVASSTEMIDSPFECDSTKCIRAARMEARQKNPNANVRDITSKSYNYTYNCKTLADYSEIPDAFKDDMETILEKQGDHETMIELMKQRRGSIRYESSFTKNVYELQIPSCTKMLLAQANFISESDPVSMYYGGLAVYIKNMFIYAGDDADGNPEYYHIDVDSDPEKTVEKIGQVIDILKTLSQTELTLISSKAQDMMYIPKFKLKTICPDCGAEKEHEFDISQLVFLLVQSTEVAIE